MAPSVERVDHIHVFVRDRAAAERWYAESLGFARVAALAHWADEGGPVMIGNSSDTVRLALFEGPPEKCRSTIAMAVSSEEFLAWQRHLAQVLGCPIEAVDHGVAWSLYFSDPDENPFEITSSDHGAIVRALRGADC